MEGKEIFSIFGHGAIYGHNTLQNLVDLYMLNDPLNYNNDIPFISETTSRQTKGPDSLQLSDLNRTRNFFLQNIQNFIQEPPIKISVDEIIEEEISSMPIQIADAFLFPIINIATRSNPKAAEKAILQLSKYFREHEWNGENDIPSLSDKLINLLSKTYTRKEISTEIREETAKIWLEMFNRKGKLDDIILFLDAWLNTGLTINIDLSNIISNVKKEIIQPSFIREISSRQFVLFIQIF